MADHEELSAATRGGKCGCVAASIVGFPVFSVLFFLAFYGDCFDSECHRGENLRLLVVVLITLAVAVPVGLLIRKLVNGRNQTG